MCGRGREVKREEEGREEGGEERVKREGGGMLLHNG